MWNDAFPAVMGSPASRQDSIDSAAASSAKKRKLESPGFSASLASNSISSIISKLRQPLLQLEARVANITNIDMVLRDENIADDNMSTDSSDEDQAKKERLERAWKKLVHRVRETPTKRHGQIRELVVAAISAARKAHLPAIVAQLRDALLLYHPNAAGDCKAAAIKVLEENGDYDGFDDDDVSSDDEEEDAVNEDQPAETEEVPSVLCAEAAVMKCSLDGSVDGQRTDWIDAVRACKSISRLAALTTGFVQDAMEKLQKIELEQADLTDALARWEKDEERREKNTKAKSFKGPSEVWANVRYTDEIVMAKAEDYPWWPAKKCIPKDPAVAEALSKVHRCLVSLVGEKGGLRVIKNEDLKPFTGNTIEEEDGLAEFPKTTRNELDECMAMARRILRGKKKRKK